MIGRSTGKTIGTMKVGNSTKNKDKQEDKRIMPGIGFGRMDQDENYM